MHSVGAGDRERVAHAGYDKLLALISELQTIRSEPSSVIVAGTPASPYALSYPRWSAITAGVQISPGTVVYNDTTSLEQMPPEWGLVPAALVLASVVSHPRAGRVTCDAGHKSVSADAGVPTCAVVGHADWKAAPPSEEHLPIDCGMVSSLPGIGTNLYLLPRHICPTVNNFDEALLIRNGRVERAVPVTARGHDGLSTDNQKLKTAN